jgi:L-fuconolactonase
MGTDFIDIHPHIIADDDAKYPRSPLFGVQSDWSRERPVTVEGLLAAMEKAGVGKAAVVQASTCYGYDNSYLTDSIAKHKDRLTAVGSVDLRAPDATDTIRHWIARGVAGLRLFTGGSTAAFDPSLMDDPLSFPAWELCGEVGLSICLQTDPTGLAQVAGLAKRFPKVRIILDHLGRPELKDGASYKKASSLFGLVPFENVYLKVTPRIFVASGEGEADPASLFARLTQTFGAKRMAWGSNFPASEGSMANNLALGKACLESVSKEDRAWIFSKTAQTLYPVLAD